MHIIQTENIVANYFQQNPDTKSVKLSKIQEIKKHIETSFRKKKMFVIVDFTKDSLINMVNISPDIFERKKDDCIILKNRKKLEKDGIRYFNAKIDYAIRDTYLQLTENFKEQA